MSRDGAVVEMMSMMALRASVWMGIRQSRKATMKDIGGIDILVGIGVVSAAEAGRESIDEGDRVRRLGETRSQQHQI
jgi:hypothetical protein